MAWRFLWSTVFALACVADPDDGDTGAGSTSDAATVTSTTTMSTGSTAATEASGDSAASPACLEAVEEADAFVMLNSACNTDEDCGTFNGFCYPLATCGTVAMNAGANEAEWNTLHGMLESECGPCGADPCGACPVCNFGTCGLTLECG